MLLSDTDFNRLAVTAARGDRTAVNELVTHLYPLVLKYCRRRIGALPSHSAEDVTQEVCLALVKALPTYTDQGRFLAFAYGIASNKVVDAFRCSTRLPQPVAELPDTECHRDGPEIHALLHDEQHHIEALLATLTVRQQTVLRLRIFHGLSTDETAAVLATTPGAVRVTQHRALTRLKAKLTSAPSRPPEHRPRQHPALPHRRQNKSYPRAS
ncbi:RNA polymerase sigma factor ShbA [Nocardia grenadensis]|uniref:RNA polymerase sigma factor ShbA n=1 Tax=Nocardia grenadensis TaxID=931537 RepID=UPI003D8A0C37